MNSIPSIKIGRLAVDKKFQGKGIGVEIVNLIKSSFSDRNNKTGCKPITVDSYEKSIYFYKSQEFERYPIKLEDDETSLMYFNLSNYNRK